MPTRSADHIYDLVVIGAGVLGACAAYLARRQCSSWTIAVLDKSFAANGATAWSAGLCSRLARTERIREWAQRSGEIYDDWLMHSSILQSARSFRPARYLLKPSSLSTLRELSFDSKIDAVPLEDLEGNLGTSLLNPNELVAVAGDRIQVISAAALSRDAIQLSIAPFGNPSQAPSVLLEGFQVDSCKVTDGVVQVLAQNGDGCVQARRAIVATGPWGMNHPCELMRSPAARVKRIVALHVYWPVRPDSPMLYLFEDKAFLLPMLDQGYWLFSYTSNVWDAWPDTNSSLTLQDFDEGVELLEKYLPELANRCYGGRVFCDSYTQDRTPVVMAAQQSPMIVRMFGGSGAGVRLGPAMAEEAIKLLRPPDMPS